MSLRGGQVQFGSAESSVAEVRYFLLEVQNVREDR